MRQSRRANTGNRRDTLARRWRPWLPNRALDAPGDPTVAAGAPVAADQPHLLRHGSTVSKAAQPGRAPPVRGQLPHAPPNEHGE
jgi:hypothetical protein